MRSVPKIILLALVAAVPAPCGSQPIQGEPPSPPETTATEWSPGSTLPLDDRGVTLTLVSTDPAVGLPLKFRLEVPVDGQSPPPSINWPGSTADLGEFESVIGIVPRAPEAATDRLVSTWMIRTFAAGEVELPSFPIGIGDRIVVVPPTRIAVASIAGSDTDPTAHRDIAGPADVKLDTSGAWGPIVALLLIGTVAIAWFLRKANRPSPSTPSTPADRWALSRLDELDSSDLLARGRVHRYYVELTDVTRRFIERRHGLAAPERTTPEFVGEATRHPDIDERHTRFLGNLLRTADMVKFAGDRPSRSEAKRHLEMVRDYVREVGPGATADDGDQVGVETASSGTLAPGIETSSPRESRIDDAIDGLDRLEDRS